VPRSVIVGPYDAALIVERGWQGALYIGKRHSAIAKLLNASTTNPRTMLQWQCMSMLLWSEPNVFAVPRASAQRMLVGARRYDSAALLRCRPTSVNNIPTVVSECVHAGCPAVSWRTQTALSDRALLIQRYPLHALLAEC
jgi:hypothetical protein